MTSFLNDASAVCPLGTSLTEIAERLFIAPSSTPDSLSITEQFTPGRPIPLGLVKQPLAEIEQAIDNTRNNRLLLTALQPLQNKIDALKAHYGSHRIGAIIGSSTSGIAEGEAAIAHHQTHTCFPPEYHYQQQEIGAPSAFVAKAAGITGPAWTISTACTSGAKALASAARLLQQGVCDAVIAGGGDSMCRLTTEGFSSLGAVSRDICNPFSANRTGINIGEAAALFIISRETGPVRLLGVGETSDAHHISAPHPEGLGAEAAMHQALTSAELAPSAVDYINLHGTATGHNDQMEAAAVNRIFGSDTACSSTKPFTGHTLGAAGALEALFCWMALQRNDGKIPPHLWDRQRDPNIAPLNGLMFHQLAQPLTTTLSNSFAFGGNNIALLLGRS